MKGFDLLLEALTQPGLEHAHVAIGGAGSQLSSLREQSRAAGTADRVHLLGGLTPGQVTTAMAAADVVVVPSRHEAFGIVALEAWRAGAPLVGSVHGGMSEVVTDGVDGLLVDPTDPVALSAGLGALLVDDALRQQLVTAGRNRATAYLWSEVVSSYVGVYEEVGA